jgi:hypothetical protein
MKPNQSVTLTPRYGRVDRQLFTYKTMQLASHLLTLELSYLGNTGRSGRASSRDEDSQLQANTQ